MIQFALCHNFLCSPAIRKSSRPEIAKRKLKFSHSIFISSVRSRKIYSVPFNYDIKKPHAIFTPKSDFLIEIFTRDSLRIRGERLSRLISGYYELGSSLVIFNYGNFRNNAKMQNTPDYDTALIAGSSGIRPVGNSPFGQKWQTVWTLC